LHIGDVPIDDEFQVVCSRDASPAWASSERHIEAPEDGAEIAASAALQDGSRTRQGYVIRVAWDVGGVCRTWASGRKKMQCVREEAALGDEHPRQAAAKVEWARARGVWWERV
jgi:hypothetical protein